MRVRTPHKTSNQAKPRKIPKVFRGSKSSEIRGILDSRDTTFHSRPHLIDRPETSPEAIRECLAKVEIALKAGNEQQAISSIRYAFSTGLCNTEIHDPRDLDDDEPLAATILGGSVNNQGDPHLIRVLDTLERYGFLTVGQVRGVGYFGIRNIPSISSRYADLIAQAVGMPGATPIH